MAKVTCKCGSIIVDTSDDLPYKAHLLSDEDFFNFFDEVDIGDGAEKFDRLIEYLYEVYQCDECFNLIVFRDNERFDFQMLGESKNVLQKYYQGVDKNEKYKIIDPSNYFNDELMQFEHESKGYLSGIGIRVLGHVFNLTFYTSYRFMQDIESELKSNQVVIANEYEPNILFVSTICPKEVKRAIVDFVKVKSL